MNGISPEREQKGVPPVALYLSGDEPIAPDGLSCVVGGVSTGLGSCSLFRFGEGCGGGSSVSSPGVGVAGGGGGSVSSS